MHCAPHRHGPYCDVCYAGYYLSSSSGQCQLCDRQASSIALTSLITPAVVLVLLAIAWHVRIPAAFADRLQTGAGALGPRCPAEIKNLHATKVSMD